MNKLLIFALTIASINACYTQVDLDLHSVNAVYKGSVKTVTASYYKPIYEEETFVNYELVNAPAMYQLNFNEAGQKMLRKEFDVNCGLDTSCIIATENYKYENEILTSKKRIAEISRHETYTYGGDSIIYNSKGTYKLIRSVIYITANKKTEKTVNRLGNTQSTKITYFNNNGYTEKFEKYWVGELKETIDYVYQDNDPSLISTITTTYHNPQHKIVKQLSYNEHGDFNTWKVYNNEGELYYQLKFEYSYDEAGNWTEKTIRNIHDRITIKIVKTYEYY